jgi:hypothetical protein
MIVYFPGFRAAFIQAYDTQLKPNIRREPFLLDHFTLEPAFDRWHITTSDAGKAI